MFKHKGTIVRTVLLIITWLNVWLDHMGLVSIPVVSEETIALVLTTIVSVWTWFKNNYITLKKGKAQYDTLKKKGLE